MKTSKIIIIAFFTFIIAGMLILFTSSKMHEKYTEKNIYHKEFSLPEFSVIVAEKGADIHIDHSDTTKVSIECFRDKKNPSKMYEIVSDTLHIYGGLRTFVKCKNINNIVTHNAFWVGLFRFRPDSLTINAIGGNFYFDNKGIDEKSFNIGITAKENASIELTNVNGNNISFLSDNASLRLQCKIKGLYAKLENHASVYSGNPQSIKIERDSSSSVEIQNYTFVK